MKDYNWGWCSGHSSQRGGGIDNAEVVIRIDAMIKLADYMEKYNREKGRSQLEVVDSASPRVYSSLPYVISLCRIHLGCAPGDFSSGYCARSAGLNCGPTLYNK